MNILPHLFELKHLILVQIWVFATSHIRKMYVGIFSFLCVKISHFQWFEKIFFCHHFFLFRCSRPLNMIYWVIILFYRFQLKYCLENIFAVLLDSASKLIWKADFKFIGQNGVFSILILYKISQPLFTLSFLASIFSIFPWCFCKAFWRNYFLFISDGAKTRNYFIFLKRRNLILQKFVILKQKWLYRRHLP